MATVALARHAWVAAGSSVASPPHFIEASAAYGDRSKPINILKRNLQEECHDSAPVKKLPKKDAAIGLDSHRSW